MEMLSGDPTRDVFEGSSTKVDAWVPRYKASHLYLGEDGLEPNVETSPRWSADLLLEEEVVVIIMEQVLYFGNPRTRQYVYNSINIELYSNAAASEYKASPEGSTVWVRFTVVFEVWHRSRIRLRSENRQDDYRQRACNSDTLVMRRVYFLTLVREQNADSKRMFNSD